MGWSAVSAVTVLMLTAVTQSAATVIATLAGQVSAALLKRKCQRTNDILKKIKPCFSLKSCENQDVTFSSGTPHRATEKMWPPLLHVYRMSGWCFVLKMDFV